MCRGDGSALLGLTSSTRRSGAHSAERRSAPATSHVSISTYRRTHLMPRAWSARRTRKRSRSSSRARCWWTRRPPAALHTQRGSTSSSSPRSSLPPSSSLPFPSTSFPLRVAWRARSKEPPLPTDRRTGGGRTSEPLLELPLGNAPDATDPYRGNPRGIGPLHRAEPAQDGRGVNAQAARDLIRGEKLLITCGRC